MLDYLVILLGINVVFFWYYEQCDLYVCTEIVLENIFTCSFYLIFKISCKRHSIGVIIHNFWLTKQAQRLSNLSEVIQLKSKAGPRTTAF